MRRSEMSRREFAGAVAAVAVRGAQGERPAVSVVRIRNGKIGAAVEEAVDLLGGIEKVTRGKERIMLKPNLVFPSAQATTNREVVRSLAKLMQGAHKDVAIGEGSAAAEGFNA